MNPTAPNSPSVTARIREHSLLDALRSRRSRRFGAGLKMPGGPLAFQSRFAPAPLAEDEVAALAFAACGITGHALADLSYARGDGGNIMAGLVGRTVAAGDGIQSTALIITNDDGTYLLKRPRDFSAAEIAGLIQLARAGELTEIYRRSRVQLKTGRTTPPMEPIFNLNCNRWSLHAKGGTYLLPINDLTLLYINALLEIFNETTAAFVLDERANFRPAGIGRFARSKGGHLDDEPAKGRLATIKHLEFMVTEFISIEQGMMMQNVALMTEALGLGGFPNFANHETAWFGALDFKMETMPASRYLGMNRLASLGARWLGKDFPLSFPLALERDGEVLLKPFCPPYYPSMRAAVEAVVELKFGAQGIFRAAAGVSAWKDAPGVRQQVAEISEPAIAAAVAYCEYVWNRYGRFPAHLPPFRTVVGFQAMRVDAEFYDHFYVAEALGPTQRADFARWSAEPERVVNHSK